MKYDETPGVAWSEVKSELEMEVRGKARLKKQGGDGKIWEGFLYQRRQKPMHPYCVGWEICEAFLKKITL